MTVDDEVIDEFMAKVISILPNAEFGEDSDGQIVIYTNLRYEGDNVVEMEELV